MCRCNRHAAVKFIAAYFGDKSLHDCGYAIIVLVKRNSD